MVATTASELRIVHVEVQGHQGDPFGAWVVDATVDAVARIRELLLDSSGADPTQIAVVAAVPEPTDAWQAAAADGLCEALRGVVGGLTLEKGPQLRLNLVLSDVPEGPAVEKALEFLSSPQAGFVAGSTFDLRRAR